MGASRHTYGVFVTGSSKQEHYENTLCWDLDSNGNRPACYGSKQEADAMCERFTANSHECFEYKVIQLR